MTTTTTAKTTTISQTLTSQKYQSIDQQRLKQIEKVCKKLKDIEPTKTEIRRSSNLLISPDRNNLKSIARFQEWYFGGGNEGIINDNDETSKISQKDKKLDIKNYLFCTPPKAGTTNWQRLLMAIDQNQPDLSKIQHEMGDDTFFKSHG